VVHLAVVELGHLGFVSVDGTCLAHLGFEYVCDIAGRLGFVCGDGMLAASVTAKVVIASAWAASPLALALEVGLQTRPPLLLLLFRMMLT
jgi:hypothetical protein